MKWISVKDRLPERGIEVLIYVNCKWIVPYRILARLGYKYDNSKVFNTGDDKIDLDEVSHWTPLPPPPRKEER